jgi:hypothetical protein
MSMFNPTIREEDYMLDTGRVVKRKVIRCNCGEEVLCAKALWNACHVCGTGYNLSGQELSDPKGWDEQDRYDTFGPQNGPDDDW